MLPTGQRCPNRAKWPGAADAVPKYLFNFR